MWNGIVSERRISKRLKLVKRVRENYVRDDVSCGFACCGGSGVVNDKVSVITIPDPDVMMAYKGLLKSEYINGIICHSVLKSLPRNEERNIKEIIKERGYVMFYDDFCVSTCGRGLDGVVEFYRNHLPQHEFIVLNMGNIKEYGKYVSDDIRDLIDTVEEVHEVDYEEYKENLDIMYGRKELYKGILEVSMYNCYSGYVIDGGVKVLIVGKRNMNRGLNGDEVYVEIIDRSDEDKIIVGNDGDVDGMSNENANVVDDKVFGKIVGINRRKCKITVGTISSRTVHGSGTQNVLVIPIDRRIPAIRIRTSQVDELVNRRLCIEIDGWDRTSNYPTGHYYKRMSEIGDKDGEMEAILVGNGISHYEMNWSQVLNDEMIPKDLKRAYEEVKEGNREDLRELTVVSIDPPGCTDIDDGLHFRMLPNGNYEVGVHIADVILYVEKNSTLDRIACDRGTTVYLPGRRIDMIPPELSSDLCSLVENKDRATFSVIWEMNNDGGIIKTHFSRSLIRSRKSFSYEEANNIINGNKRSDNIYESLRMLNEISKILRKKRFDNGSLDLSTRELIFKENGFEVKEHLPTNFLVEEFMILANTTVASFIYHHYPDSSLLRRHPPPSALILDPDIDCSSSKSLNDSLMRVDDTRRDIIKRTVIKSMNQAIYFISGDTTDFNHYGLATPIYTHFTSPIRRYADVVVHRILNNILHLFPCDDVHVEELGVVSFKRRSCYVEDESFIDEDTCRNLNVRHRSAQRASWECDKLMIYMTLREIEPVVDGYVSIIKPNGIVVYIPEYNIEDVILSDDQFKQHQSIRIKIIRNDEMFFLRRRFSLELVGSD